MKGKGVRYFVQAAFLLLTGGCSSLTPDQQLNEQQLSRYLQQPELLIFYYPTPLQFDQQLKLLHMESQTQPLASRFHPSRESRGLIERFVAGVPLLASGDTRIVEPDEWSGLTAPADTPVLFFQITWRMNYQRLPPQFRNNRLQAGVIAKVIPLGQVLNKKGTIALRTAAWESSCHFEAFQGAYLPIDGWLADEAARLHEGIAATQRACGAKLAREFTHRIENTPH